jgi:hypothetical protein
MLHGRGFATATTSAAFFPHCEQRNRGANSMSVVAQATRRARASADSAHAHPCSTGGRSELDSLPPSEAFPRTVILDAAENSSQQFLSVGRCEEVPVRALPHTPLTGYTDTMNAQESKTADREALPRR